MEQINPAAENQKSSKGHFTPQTNPELASKVKWGTWGKGLLQCMPHLIAVI